MQSGIAVNTLLVGRLGLDSGFGLRS